MIKVYCKNCKWIRKRDSKLQESSTKYCYFYNKYSDTYTVYIRDVENNDGNCKYYVPKTSSEA